jgi:hypothetical protein
MADRTLTVKIVGDARSLEREFKKADRSATAFGSRMERANKKLQGGILGGIGGRGLAIGGGSLLGGAALSSGFQNAINDASALEEQMSRTRVVFEDSADTMLEWSRTSATALGLARSEALAAAAGIAGIAQTSGLTEAASAKMGRQIVQLAADMASFNDEDPTEMLERLRSGLVGEAEPLRRFQVLLSEARVQTEAYASGIARAGSKLTEGQKVQARFNIIMRDTVKQQGDFARTSENFANQQRRLTAEFRNLSAEIGGVTLPVVTKLIQTLNDGITISRELGKEIRRLPDVPGIDFEFPSGRDFINLVPGINQVAQLADGVEIVKGLVVDVHKEASKPLNFDFSAVNRLTEGLETAGLAAKSLIEQRRALEQAGGRGVNITTEQRNQFFDSRIARRVDRVQDLEGARAQLRELRAIARDITARIAVQDDITRKLNLEDDLLSVQREIRSRQAQLLDASARAARDAADKARELREAERERLEAARDNARDVASFGVEVARTTASLSDDLGALRSQEAVLRHQLSSERGSLELRRQLLQVQQDIAATLAEQRAAQARQRENRQFRALGLGPGGDELIPNAASLRKSLGSIREAVRGTVLDTSETKSVMARIRRVLTGEFGRVSEDVRATMRDMLADIKNQLDEFGGGPETKFRKTSANRLLKGLGLDPDEIRALRGRLSQVGVGGTVPTRQLGAFGMAVPAGSAPPTSFNLYIDGAPVEATVTRRQRTRKRRNPIQKRGPSVTGG